MSKRIAHDSAAAQRMAQRLILIFRAGTHEKKADFGETDELGGGVRHACTYPRIGYVAGIRGEHDMFSGLLQKHKFIGVVLSAMLIAAWTAGGLAEESGHWKAKGVLVVTSQPTVKVADQRDHQLMLTEFDGIVFNEGDKPFLDNARYQVVDLNDSGGMVSGGYKTFTADDGSKVFAQYKMTGGVPPTFNGEWTFVGGTQKYKGISGSGTFR